MPPRYGINGFAELAGTLRGIAAAMTKGERAKARAAALEPIKRHALDNLDRNNSVVTGALKAAQVIVADEANENRSLLATRKGRVKKQSPSSIEHMVEFGTAPHFQPNRNGGQMHPGARPKPFKRPALDEGQEEAVQAYSKAIGETVRKAAARTSRRRS